ncbi:hypothetical protein HHI36_017979 [Cryptolaemus montrouzieri]|uniref:Purine nucleoside phosphorylase n=1 Tax=Cryptolaemus montrouzieri TaxID=559131 RepID=A0ABD2NZ01_9CUCU
MTGVTKIINGNSGKCNGHCKSVENGNCQRKDSTHEENYTYEMIQQTANYLSQRVPFEPKIGIICGSGLGSLAQQLKQPIEFPYSTIPNFPVSTVEGHAGKLIFGFLSNVPVVCMQGRFHFYEGYPLWKCAMPVRVMKLMGVCQLIATNAAGGLHKNYKVGDIMLVKDHINMMGFAGNNPLQGPNEERFGPRFPPMNKAYDKELIQRGIEIGKELGLKDNIHTGVYTCLGGPNFETVAELRALKMLGCDAVGMSTVHEVITARHCDMNVLAFSLITNECILEYDSQSEPNHEEVMDAAKMREELLQKFVAKIIDYINKSRLTQNS